MHVLLRTISTRSVNNTNLYYGKEPIDEYEGKPIFHALDPKKPVPFDTENVTDLKRLLSKITTFKNSGHNKEVVPVWVKADGTIKREVTEKELYQIQRRKLPTETSNDNKFGF